MGLTVKCNLNSNLNNQTQTERPDAESSTPPRPLTATLGLLAVMTREPSSDPQWDEIAWTEINTSRGWESEGIDSSVGSLSLSRLPYSRATAEWKHPWVMLTTLSPYQTPCPSHAAIHLLQNNSFVLSFPFPPDRRELRLHRLLERSTQTLRRASLWRK